jgi:hypothetical protein
MSSSPSAAETGSRRLFLLVAAPLFVLYLVTANWTTPYNIDALTNVLTADEIATKGDVYLDEYEGLAEPDFQGTAAWVVPARDSATSQYPPGAASLAVPLYRIWPGHGTTSEFVGSGGEAVVLPIPPLFPAAVTSAAVAATAVGLLALIFRSLSDDHLALLGAYAAGLGSGVWSVASDSLWQHGPAMMWIAAGTLLAASRRVWAGFAFGAAVLTRPHTALVAAGNGLWQSWQRRSARPALQIAIGSAIGLAGVIVYNRFVFGTVSITAGYGGSFATRASSLDILDYLGNIALAMVHPIRGLFVYTPFLVLLLPGLGKAWRVAPGWVRGSAIGGLAYVLLQLKANRYSGGEGFWGYRYPLEFLAATAPLFFLAYTEWIRKHPSAALRRWFGYLVALSIVLTALGAIYFSSFWASPSG